MNLNNTRREQLDRLCQNALNIDKRILFAMSILLWLHGVTTGIVYEGQEGLLNRFLWTFVFFLFPIIFLKSNAWRKTATIWLYFELATFIMCCSNSLAWYRNPKNLKPLPDLGHDILLEWRDIHTYNPLTASWHVTEASMVPDLIMVLLLFSTFCFTIRHPTRMKMVHRFFIVYGTLCIMRSVSVISTSLPDSAPRCREITPLGNLSSGAHPWEDINVRVVMIKSLKLLVPIGEVTCGDMVFSGHSMVMTLCAMTWHTYYKWVPGQVNYVKVSVWAVTIFGLVSIVWVRMHYSIDVVLALYFTVTLWSSYHRIANDVSIGHRFSNVWLIDALLIYPAIEWIETEDDEEEKTENIHSDVDTLPSSHPTTRPRRSTRRKSPLTITT